MYFSISDLYFLEYVKLIGHKSSVTAIIVLENKRIISGSKDGEIIIWEWSNDRNSIELKSRLLGHTDEISQVIVSKDNKTLISSSFDHTIRIWECDINDNYKCKRTLTGHTDKVISILIDSRDHQIQESNNNNNNNNNTILVSTSNDQTIKIWNINDGNCLYTKSQIFQTGTVVSCVIDLQNKDNSIILYYSDTNGNIKRWTYKNGGTGFPDENDGDWISLHDDNENIIKTNDLIVSPDSSLFAIDGSFGDDNDDNEITTTTITDSKEYKEEEEGYYYDVNDKNNNKHKSTIHLYNVNNQNNNQNKPLIKFACKGNIKKLKFSPVSYFIIGIFKDSFVIWDLDIKESKIFNPPYNYKSNQDDDIKSNNFKFQPFTGIDDFYFQDKPMLSKCLSLDVDNNNCIYVGHEDNTISVFKSNTTRIS